MSYAMSLLNESSYGDDDDSDIFNEFSLALFEEGVVINLGERKIQRPDRLGFAASQIAAREFALSPDNNWDSDVRLSSNNFFTDNDDDLW